MLRNIIAIENRHDIVTSQNFNPPQKKEAKDFDSLVAHLSLNSKPIDSGSSSLPEKIDISAITKNQSYTIQRGSPTVNVSDKIIHIPTYYTLRDEAITLAREIVRPIAMAAANACENACSGELEPKLCKYLHALNDIDQVDVFAAALFLPKAKFKKWSKKISDQRTLANVFNLPVEFVVLRKSSLEANEA
jgi:hypothetical protein